MLPFFPHPNINLECFNRRHDINDKTGVGAAAEGGYAAPPLMNFESTETIQYEEDTKQPAVPKQ